MKVRLLTEMECENCNQTMRVRRSPFNEWVECFTDGCIHNAVKWEIPLITLTEYTYKS